MHAGPILIAAFAAYAFAWMHFPGRRIMFILVVGLLVVPLQMALIPLLTEMLHEAGEREALLGVMAGVLREVNPTCFEAIFPAPWTRDSKFWVPVRRVNNAHGDRNLVCACPPMEEYSEE